MAGVGGLPKDRSPYISRGQPFARVTVRIASRPAGKSRKAYRPNWSARAELNTVPCYIHYPWYVAQTSLVAQNLLWQLTYSAHYAIAGPAALGSSRAGVR